MTWQEILFICSGGVLFLMFAWFLVCTIEARKVSANKRATISDYYCEKNLPRIEYDLAFYDDATLRLLKESMASQVTIDELMGNKEVEKLAKKMDEAITARIETSGIEEITGSYLP